MAVSIVPFSEENKHFIKTLNYEWLQQYFSVEPHDAEQLSSPAAEIIDKGGYIFYAAWNGEIAGTATLLKAPGNEYELAKMAVTAAMQGKGIGTVLIEHCLERAAALAAKKIFLYSNTKLRAAIKMYRKYGFAEVPFENSQYQRANIKMEKLL